MQHINLIMKKLYTIIFVPLILFFSTLPVHAEWQGLIRPYCTDDGCTLCDGIKMIKGIMDFLTKISISIAMLSILVGGIMYIFAGTNPGLVKKAQKIFKDTVIGLAIIFGAWLIINIIFAGLGVSSFAISQGGWFVIKCK